MQTIEALHRRRSEAYGRVTPLAQPASLLDRGDHRRDQHGRELPSHA